MQLCLNCAFIFCNNFVTKLTSWSFLRNQFINNKSCNHLRAEMNKQWGMDFECSYFELKKRFECTKLLPEWGSLFCTCGSSFWGSGGLLSLLVLSTASPSFLDFSLLFRGDPAAAAAALFFVTLRIENVLFTVVVVSLKKPKSLNLHSFIYVEFRHFYSRADSILSQSQLAEACFFQLTEQRG